MTINRKFFLVLALIVSSVINAQVVKKYDYQDFTKLDISSAFEVSITQGEEYIVSLTIDESMVDHLIVELNEDELAIGMKGWKSNSNVRPKAEIHLPSLTELEVSGASLIKLNNIEESNLEIDISGASIINGKINAQKFKLDASGASKIEINGKINKMELYLSGASRLDAMELEISDEIIFDASGASSAKCYINGDMYLKLEGASILSFKGEGDIVKQEVSGASVIERK